MRLMFAFIVFASLAASAGAVTRVDPVLGKSPVAETSPEEKAHAVRIDPVIGNNPAADAGPQQPAKQLIIREERPKRPHRHDRVNVIQNYYVVSPYAQPYQRQEILTYGLSDLSESDSRITLEGQAITLINRWKGKCNQRHCMVSAGYMTRNPAKGVLVLMNPALSNGPELFFPPEETGPLRIRQDDSLNFRLIIESVSGSYDSGTERITSAGSKQYFFHIMNGGWEF